jgi:hypothetical protein
LFKVKQTHSNFFKLAQTDKISFTGKSIYIQTSETLNYGKVFACDLDDVKLTEITDLLKDTTEFPVFNLNDKYPILYAPAS